MKMNLTKKISFVLLLILGGLQLQAQNFSVSWGDKAKLKYAYDDAVPIDGNKKIVLKLKASGGGMFGGSAKITPIFLLVDDNMETLLEKEMEVEEKNAVLKGFEKYANNVFFLYSAYDKESKTTSVYALKINEKTLEPSSKIILGTYESDSKSDQAEVEYGMSSDSSKILLFVEGPERKKENKKIFVGVFNTDLKKIWAREIEMPILEKFVSIYDKDITDDGKVFVAIKHYEKEVSRETVREDGRKVPSYVYKILVYSPGTTKEKEITLNLGDNFVQGTKLIYDKNGTISLAGLYKRKHNGNLNGVFYATIDPVTYSIKSPKMVDFDAEIVRLVDKDNFGSDKDSDPGLYPDFKIRHIMRRNNGSIDLISEYYELRIITTYSKYGTRTDYRYQYGDIVNTNIDKNGKATFTRVPKNQKFTNANLFMGYYPFVFNDKLVLLFNDDKDNVDRDLEKKPDDVMNFKQSVLAAATIDAKGVLSRQAIFSNDDEDYITLPRYTTRITENKFLIKSDLFKIFKKRTRYGFLEVK